MWPNSQETADVVTFIEGILNGKLHRLCSICCKMKHGKMKIDYVEVFKDATLKSMTAFFPLCIFPLQNLSDISAEIFFQLQALYILKKP